MLLLAPVREELMFRAIIFCMLYIRSACKLKTSTQHKPDLLQASATYQCPSMSLCFVTLSVYSFGNDDPPSKLSCAALSGIVFGLVHLMNLLGVRYQPLYISLQVLLGILLGIFYSLRFVLSQTVFQSIVMHMANNFYSSFVPLDVELDLTNPLIALPLCTTCVVYATLTYWSMKQVFTEGIKPFAPLHDKLRGETPTRQVDNR